MLQINTLTRLDLGIKGENNAHNLFIDMNAWYAEYPNGTVTVWHKRSGDETKYPASGVTFDRDTGILKWTPDSTDTYYNGEGAAEIRLTENDVIKKSKDIITNVANSLMNGSGETIESGWQNIIDTVSGYAADAAGSADDAEDFAEDAQDAQGAAEDAKEAAEAAQTAAETAQGKAEDAQGAAETAQGKAEDAQTSAETAQGKAEDAQEAAEAAQTAAETAQGKAEDAQEAAEAAQTAAETAQGKAEDAQTAAETAQGAAETAQAAAEAWATGGSSGTPSATNNAKYYSEQAEAAAAAAAAMIDDTAGSGDTGKVWSADKTTSELAGKADKVASAVSGNFAGLDANGNLTDSGHKHSDYLTQHQDISGKADKAYPTFTGGISLGRKLGSTIGDYSVALGSDNEATAPGAFVQGASNETTIAASWASVMGTHLIASKYAQHVTGNYNVQDTGEGLKGHYAEIVGNGENINNVVTRSNARTLDWDGNERLMGDLYIHCNSDSTGGKSISGELEKKAPAIEESDSTEAAVKTIQDGAEDLPMAVKVAISPVQDLHGQEYPYPGGAGKNKLLDTGWTADKYLNAQGGLADSDRQNTSDFCPVKPSQAYVYSGTNLHVTGEITNIYVQVCYYDDNKDFITGGRINSQVGNVSFTTSASTAYVRVSAGKDATNLQLEEGSTESDYVPYSNICPISGWSQVKISKTGKNLLNQSGTGDGYVNSKYLDNQGTLVSANSWTVSEYVRVQPNTTYTVTGLYGSTPKFCEYDENKNFVTYHSSTLDVTEAITFTTGANTKYLRFSMIKSTETGYADKMLVEGSTALPYEAYNGTTKQITLPTPPGTVYGGTLTVNKDGTGLLTVDMGIVDLGDFSWVYTETGTVYPFFHATISNAKGSAEGICSMYKRSVVNVSNDTNCAWIVLSNGASVRIRDLAYTDATTFTTAVTGQKLVYELATPVTYTLTAEQVGQILSLKDENNIWADCGNVLSVEYSADTKSYIDNLFASIVNATGVSF